MKAATISDGGALAVAEHPDPQPGHGEVLVRVRAAGLNGADMLQRKGGYPAPPGSPPDIPGLELAGEVVALGPGAEGFEEHGPFDVVLELVGAPNVPGDLKALATHGRIVVIGVGAGFKAEVNLLALMGKRAMLRASTLRARPLEDKAQTARAMEREVLPLFAAGRLRVPIAEAFALADVEAAYDRFAAGRKLGK